MKMNNFNEELEFIYDVARAQTTRANKEETRRIGMELDMVMLRIELRKYKALYKREVKLRESVSS